MPVSMSDKITDEQALKEARKLMNKCLYLLDITFARLQLTDPRAQAKQCQDQFKTSFASKNLDNMETAFIILNTMENLGFFSDSKHIQLEEKYEVMIRNYLTRGRYFLVETKDLKELIAKYKPRDAQVTNLADLVYYGVLMLKVFVKKLRELEPLGSSAGRSSSTGDDGSANQHRSFADGVDQASFKFKKRTRNTPRT
ncbi:hypothetical protein Ciccas_008531 [Cichlidogyrus casuarinus]|uniref:Uncharacterized protein n=1 Tax=Cichlidogyrus casuarinus TaxID=1844966 RepID=A0ABD2PZN6_9PLAT